ncbi:MAG: WecB/TagA/CpsF family glycosyltransferase [Rhizobiaceae bacterium]
MNVQTQPPRALPGAMDILGVAVTDASRADAIALVDEALQRRRYTKVAFLNAHSANTAAEDAEFAAVLKTFTVFPDGIGVDIAAKILYGRPFADNLNGTDFVPALLAAVKRPLVVGIVGAVREHGERATADLMARMPQHQFVYLNDGYLTPEEEPGVIRRIEELHPDIVLVAMGVPRQEKWIQTNLDGNSCTVPIAVGALLDFLSGAVPRAPLLVRRMRFEWVYRLCMEPVRLWRRYLLGNPVFVMRILRQKLRGGRWSGVR